MSGRYEIEKLCDWLLSISDKLSYSGAITPAREINTIVECIMETAKEMENKYDSLLDESCEYSRNMLGGLLGVVMKVGEMESNKKGENL